MLDTIRVPSLKGALRMWWRAACGWRYESSEELARAERELWGFAADDTGGRSEVALQVLDVSGAEVDTREIRLSTPGAYALWAARAQPGKHVPEAERWLSGLEFTLRIDTTEKRLPELETALRAWLLFGGYGARTRRGCGTVFPIALTPDDDLSRWLPTQLSYGELVRLFGAELWSAPAGPATLDMPSLRGSHLYCGSDTDKAEAAWLTALDWLRNFRQAPAPNGTSRPQDYARDPGTPQRPGRSHWPEADHVRILSGSGPWAHTPRHRGKAVWPRASFGLPIVGQFQRKDGNLVPYRLPEPRDFELRWRDAAGKDHSRLASPLIVKALPLVSGRFVPVALWLYRAFPDGRVGLSDNTRAGGSYADFDQLVSQGGTALYAPLASPQANAAPRGDRMKTAFFEWLSNSYRVRRVAP